MNPSRSQDSGKPAMVAILGLMAFLCNGDNYAAAPLLIEIAKDLNLEMSRAALSVTAYMLPFGLFTLIFGPLADRYGKARIINIAAFGTAIFSCLGAVAFDLTSLSVIRAVNGAFAAGILPVTMSLIGEHYGRDPRDARAALGKVLGMTFLGGASATAIGGALAYLGSWRLVYLAYGIAELAVALAMLKILEKRPGTAPVLNIPAAYRDALANGPLLRTVSVIFLIGAAVFGSFAYAGKLVQARTGWNTMLVGLVLASFGVATVFGGRVVGALRQRLGRAHFPLAGILGGLASGLLAMSSSPVLLAVSLAAFGFAFIMMQPALVATAQELMPQRRGTVMSLASFNMFVGGGIGTFANGWVLDAWGFAAVFAIAAVLILTAGVAAWALVPRVPSAPAPEGGPR